MRRLVAGLFAVLSLSLLAGPREVEKTPRLEGRAVILHPAAALTEADEAELAQKGIVVRHALPGGRYLARMKEGADGTADSRIVSVEPLSVEKKLHPSAVREAALGRPLIDTNVIFHRDVPFEEARQAILEAGGAMDLFAVSYLPSRRIEVRVPNTALIALAEDERVFAISGPRNVKISAENASSAALSHVTELHSAPYGLTGKGVNVSLFELAPAQSTHVEFGGRLTVDATGGSTSDRTHATHVAGTIGAAGLRPDAKGMAPEARIYQFCVDYPGNTCQASWLELKDEALRERGIVADNNSWGYVWGWEDGSPPIWNGGDVYWGAYDSMLSAPLDEISIERDVLFVHSAGNDGSLPFGLSLSEWKAHTHFDLDANEDVPGTFCVSKNASGTDCPATTCTGACEKSLHHPLTPFDTVGTTASAKNVLAVGGVDSNLDIYSSGSRGPAKDGRVKPDVVARSVSVLSTVPTDSYRTLTGTSMSSPAVTGIAALITEQWRRTFGGATPRPAQLKALIIAGAEDLGNPGPDYTFGFGLVNAKSSVDLILADEGSGQRIRNLTFQQGQQQSVEVPIVVSATQNLRVVLNWADPAIALLGGDDVTQPALVNDLDLRVVDPSGHSHGAYVLDRGNVTTNASAGVNTTDNVEMVEIANAAPGVYRIVATGTSVTDGPQDAVLVTNVRTARPCVDVVESPSGNDSADRAYGNLAAGQAVAAGLCAQGDVDFYKFVATKTGAMSVTITTGDTPVRATITGNGISRTQDIPANSAATLNADVNTVPNTILLRIEAAGALGVEPQYSFTPEFPELRKRKRRGVN